VKLGYAIASITLLYFIVYAFACPTKELVCAVALEVFVFIAVIGFRTRKKSRHAREAQEAILDELSKHTKATSGSWKFIKTTATIVAALVLIWLSYDFTSLAFTCAGQRNIAKPMYLFNPIYRIPGIHPALSAELLAGAYIEANRLDEAETLSNFLLDIRKEIYGERHPMIAEMFGNFAFIALKRNDAKTAENYARQSIALWKETSGYHHLGNALTKLGNALTMQKRFPEAEQVYAEALVMREREFGTHSDRVLKTLQDLEVCQRSSGKTFEANKTATRVKAIEAYQRSHLSSDNPWFVPLSIVVSFVMTYIFFGPKGVLTDMALRRIESRVEKEGAGANPKDVRKLISLYNHRKDKSKVEYYEQLLTR